MNNIHQTLYIPLYGKAYVSKKGIILNDVMAEAIWDKVNFKLKAKSKSKWLAYYMAMRSAIYDEWIIKEINDNPNSIVLHIGCGLDSRYQRVKTHNIHWYDIDFDEVISERLKYFKETNYYHMLKADMRLNDWMKDIKANKDALIILEGVSMYFKPEELTNLLTNISNHFNSVKILVDFYSEKAAKMSKYKNPINDVGVTEVYGYDNPEDLINKLGYTLKEEYCMSPKKYINELKGSERIIFEKLYAGKIAKSLYRMYEFVKLI